ncbi:MAG: hypothetical protein JWM34_1827 [Ilumatobacteraceae bacterium]|nr:hypothetical protein [Ilumatobacteraceae bacterium]
MVLGIGRGKHVLERGELVGGRLVGIQIVMERMGGDTNMKVPVSQYAVEVHAPQPFVAGVEQQLTPLAFVRLGMDVAVRYVDHDAVIDWAATGGGTSGDHIKILRDVPPRGIDDESLDLDRPRRKWSAGSATIVGIATRPGTLHLFQQLHLDLVVHSPAENGGQPYPLQLDKLSTGYYGSHLVVPNCVVPVWIRPGHLADVVIDWPAAAMAFPGVGWPPSPAAQAIHDNVSVVLLDPRQPRA